jgi:hypothetical protein
MLLKRATQCSRNESQDDQQEENNLLEIPLAEWERETKNYLTTARRIAARFKSPVEEAPKHWAEFCRECRDLNHRFNAPGAEWLKAYGLWERAQKLLPEAERPGHLVAFIGAARADGKPRIKLYRFRSRWKASRNERARKMYFHQKFIQLLHVATDEEISTEVSQMNRLWPESDHWRRAQKQLERDWRTKTLSEAAFELVRDGKPVTGVALAPLVFRNQRTQDVWESHQQHLKLKQKGFDVPCDEKTFCKDAKRGISLREFRQRYSASDIAHSNAHAVRADASDSNHG